MSRTEIDVLEQGTGSDRSEATNMGRWTENSWNRQGTDRMANENLVQMSTEPIN
jgi:hypothetical protein